MGVVNTKKSGLYTSVQPVITPSGSVIPAATLAPQQLIVGGDGKAQFEGSPIETTNMIHATTITLPAFPGLISGTVNGVGTAMSEYSKKMFINGHAVVTNSAKKITNTGNAFVVPMVRATSAKTYFFLNG